MCTVSFVRTNGKVILTSNRDEKVNRPALAPKRYCYNGKVVLFPKDPKAGGTWFAVSEDGMVVVLLNGAEEKHEVQPHYGKSRGLITLEICSASDAIEEWEILDLSVVEPFTLVVFENQKLFQLRWNGKVKNQQELSISEQYIWSSATLYTPEIRTLRKQWFEVFIQDNPNPSPEEVLLFHQSTQGNNKEFGLVIDRNSVLKTTSITQTVIETNKVTLEYHDLLQQQSQTTSFIII
ncbi:MAG: hypothetical protein EAZ58_00425 [Flavobacterium sp.]|jgi:uncharacterized protein with NRDE domain|nr:MAG: hypothetical protein EAZ58_00425 [Flavobacterium sp.]